MAAVELKVAIVNHLTAAFFNLSLASRRLFATFANMAVVLENPARRWTYEEYYRLDDDQRYEIIAGNLY